MVPDGLEPPARVPVIDVPEIAVPTVPEAGPARDNVVAALPTTISWEDVGGQRVFAAPLLFVSPV